MLITAIILFIVPASLQAQDVPVRVEKPKEKKKRIKSKRLKGDKAKSNKKQIRQAKYKTRSKQGDKAAKGDITGRKYKPKRTSRKTYARPQPDPYAGRKYKSGGPDRAGPEPPPTFRKSPQGEKPRRGDITGKKRIRTRSASSARRRMYPQPDTRARSATKRGESAGRAVSVIKSVSKLAERSRTVSVSQPRTISGAVRIRRKKNPYAGREQRKGERATYKDIAGRKLRTRGKQSALGVPRRGYDAPDTYYGRKHVKEGGRFSRRTMQMGGYVTGTRKSEQAVRGAGREPSMKNYESPRAKTVKPSFNPYAGRKPLGEGGRFKDKGKPKIRSATRKSERRIRVQVNVPKSISGIRKISKPKSPYARREQRPGERTTDRDIAGRKHRTRNFESPRPSWGGAIARPDTYYGRKDRGDRVSKAQIPAYQPRREAFRATQYQGRFRQFELQPGYGNQKAIGKYQGRFRQFELQPGYGDQKAIGKYQGRFRQFELQPGYGDQKAIGKYQGRFRQFELQPGYGNQKAISKYQGNIKARKPLIGGGSISGKLWNNDGKPILTEGQGKETRLATQFQGNLKFRRPITGGGSVRYKLWNNDEKPVLTEGQGKETRLATQFQGNQKFRMAKTGGGSIKYKLWNNNETPIHTQSGGKDARAVSKYQGTFKSAGSPAKPGNEAKDAAVFRGRFKDYELIYGFSGIESARYGRKRTLAFMKLSQKKNRGYYIRMGITASRKQMHPSYSYTKSGESKNAAEEKEKTLKFRLWWSNLFKSNGNLPGSIKQKDKKPRYDKRESDLWYK